ncbi:MAG: hypothetical protein WBD36_10670 [Bacteroidota bacterium]
MKTGVNRLAIRAAKAAFVLFLFNTSLLSQASQARQVLTLQVLELNKIDLSAGKRLRLTIDELSSQTAVLSTSTKLVWTSNGESRKITVATNSTQPRYLLRVEPENVSVGSGVAASGVSFSDNSTHDLIVGVSKSAGSCTLKFMGIADVAEGPGTESHLITYTITGS